MSYVIIPIAFRALRIKPSVQNPGLGYRIIQPRIKAGICGSDSHHLKRICTIYYLSICVSFVLCRFPSESKNLTVTAKSRAQARSPVVCHEDAFNAFRSGHPIFLFFIQADASVMTLTKFGSVLFHWEQNFELVADQIQKREPLSGEIQAIFSIHSRPT